MPPYHSPSPAPASSSSLVLSPRKEVRVLKPDQVHVSLGGQLAEAVLPRLCLPPKAPAPQRGGQNARIEVDAESKGGEVRSDGGGETQETPRVLVALSVCARKCKGGG